MLYAEFPRLEKWTAPPQGDLPRPTWTKLLVGDVLLSNSIEASSWRRSPVFPMACEGCWGWECDWRGATRIVTIPNYVIWLRPRLSNCDEEWRDVFAQLEFIRETVIFPLDTWHELATQFRSLPQVYYFPRAMRADLAQLWLEETPYEIRQSDLQHLEQFAMASALASYPLELDETIETIRTRIAWLRKAPDERAEGRLIRIAQHDNVQSLYFNQRGFPEWRSYIQGRENSLVFGSDWAYVDCARG